MSKRHRIAVIGGGISGLSCAWELSRSGADVLLVEAHERVGGLVRSGHTDGYLFEWGPNSFPSTATQIRSLAAEVGVEDRIIEASPDAKVRYIYFGRRLEPIPMGPGDLMKSRIFNLRQKLRIMMEPLIPKGDPEKPESVAHFIARRFGPAPARTIVDAFVSGVYAGDARKVGVRAAFPKLWEMEQEAGSLFKAMGRMRKERKKSGGAPPTAMTLMSFRNGMEELVHAVGEKLRAEGQLVLGRTVRRLTPREGGGFTLAAEAVDGTVEEIACDHVVSALASAATGLLLADLEPMVADLLFEIEYAPVVVVHAGFSEEELLNLPKAFGFLSPRPSRLRSLGWLFNSRIFAGRAPEGHHALTGFIGGATDPSIVDAPEEALRHLVLGELSMVLRMSRFPQPDLFRCVRQQGGLPQFDLGHHLRVKAVRTLLAALPGVDITGNYLEGISLDECIRGGRAAARRVLAAAESPPSRAEAS